LVFFSWGLPLKGKKVLGFFSEWYSKKKKNASLRSKTVNHLALGGISSKITYGLGTVGRMGTTASFKIQRTWTIRQIPSFFSTERIWVLQGELVGTNSPQARNLFIKGCSPPWASFLRGYCFPLGNRVGSQRTMTIGSAWWACPGVPWSHTWWLILSSQSFWPLSIGEGVMGSLVVTRSCRALGAEKLPITRVAPQFSEYISSQ